MNGSDKETEYHVTMSLARKLKADGVITAEEYDQFDKKMRQKYQPKYGSLSALKPLI